MNTMFVNTLDKLIFFYFQVLETVLKHAGDRRIVFSCFNPDICTMVRKKQNKYPVMFLTIVSILLGKTLCFPFCFIKIET